MNENSSPAGDAMAGAIRAIRALDDALHGELDWEALVKAVEAAMKSGCATEADLQAVQDKALDVARMRAIIECLRGRAVEGAPLGGRRTL